MEARKEEENNNSYALCWPLASHKLQAFSWSEDGTFHWIFSIRAQLMQLVAFPDRLKREA